MNEYVRICRAAREPEAVTDWSQPWRVLMWTFAAAGAYSLAAAHLPHLATFPVFSWVGLPAATAWGWELAPALGYVGQVCTLGFDAPAATC